MPRHGVGRPDSVMLRNHQRTQKLDLLLLRRIVRTFVLEVLHRGEFELDIHIVDLDEITELNEKFLRHQGPTDVIAFDYAAAGEQRLHGEIFVCLPEAFRQAERYSVPWQHELVRYVVHGILHLCGFDDQAAARRRQMKQVENRALRYLQKQYYFPKLGGHRPRGGVGHHSHHQAALSAMRTGARTRRRR